MGASGFETLAGHFADRTVVTYDPRGTDRSVRTDPAPQSTPDQHADDLHRLIAALGAAPVDLFASSGGAINALALVAQHPDDVRTLVAHEPPSAQAVADREAALAACRAIYATYERGGGNAGMAHFIAVVNHAGPFSPDFAEQPAPDPAMFGMPADDDGSRDHVLLAQNMIPLTHYEHDFEALRRARTRIVLAAGIESEGILAYRAAEAIAERLGVQLEVFPSHHVGFMAGEHGQGGEPEAFAAKLREVLSVPA